jgi:hypothetical protein
MLNLKRMLSLSLLIVLVLALLPAAAAAHEAPVASPQPAQETDWTASAECVGDDLVVTIELLFGQIGWFDIYGTGPGLEISEVGPGTYSLPGPATWTDVEVFASNETNIFLGDFTCEAEEEPTEPAPPAIGVPHIGTFFISTAMAQPIYDAPGGQVVRDAAGQEIWIPNDADNNGFDTHVVTELAMEDGELWFGFWLGSATWAYVPASQVIVLPPLLFELMDMYPAMDF